LDLGKRLSAPASQYTKINLDGLSGAKSEKVMVVGKVLGQGEVENKIKISALGFSEQAKEKLKKAGCEVKSIKDEIKSNNNLEGVELI
jgi:ribosomal protein L18E